ncbi:MAG: glycosyltransferase family 39 protein [Burkholderiales bacterium]
MSALSPRQWLLLALAATLAFRGWLSAALPVTADEAYFVLWGRSPDIGFYDHPPMVGWMLVPLLAVSDAGWLARLPATLAPALVALGLRAALKRWFARDEDSASLAALAVLLVPMNFWNVLVTTDTPLVLFAAASLLAFARAAQRGSAAWFLASGVLLGLAFLSKYFAVLLGLAYLAWAIASPGAPRRWSGPALALAGALPFGLVNLYWNWQACWCNVMFNAINRHQDDASWSLATPALYVAALVYLAAPLLWYGWRARAALRAGWRRDEERVLLLAWLVPFAVFAALSPVKRIGLHWLLAFIPALVASAALALGRAQLVASVRFLAAFAALHAAAIGVLAALPLETWKSAKLYPRLVFLSQTRAIVSSVAPELARYGLAADSYSAAALLAYHARRAVPVFGAGSSHARHDDILTDWREYSGRDLIIVRRELPLLEDYRPFFREVEARAVQVHGATFHAVLGRGFDYSAYRGRVLTAVRERYYRIPAWLPPGRCYFFERYGE